jgi:NitT/TauT family transport system permease protein
LAIALFPATIISVPLGLFIGPVPPLDCPALAIVMFQVQTLAIFLMFLASFYANALNTMVGVSPASYLGAERGQISRHVVVPGTLAFIFTGVQMSVGHVTSARATL